MKKILSVIISIILVVNLFSCSTIGFNTPSNKKETEYVFEEEDENAIHIGIVTGSISQSEDDRRGAAKFQEMYGGKNVKLSVYPDNFSNEEELTIETITNLADDPHMKAIIVNQSVKGTAEAFRRIKKDRPDIICVAAETHEDLDVISSVADLVCSSDFVARGYLIVKTAHDLGCDKFIHISFPRHLAYETMSRRVNIMREACREFNMDFILEAAPDPTLEGGVTGAKSFLMEKVPEWVKKYGEHAAYFCTNDAHTETLIKQLVEYGGYFIEADLPSPLMGYPEALEIDLTDEMGDFEKILAKVESTINEKGGEGRFGTWAYSYGYTQSAGLAEHVLNVLNGESELLNMNDIAKAYNVYTPNATWNGSNYTDATTGEKLENVFLVYEDTYILGNPGKYMGTTKVKVPEKYFSIE